MLRRVQSVMYIGTDQLMHKRILAVCAEENIEMKQSSALDPVLNVLNTCTVIFADVVNSRNLFSFRESVVIIRPDERIKGLIGMGYKRFLFDSTNKQEILYCLYARQYVPTPSTRKIIVGDFEGDFEEHIFKFKNNEIYLSKGEVNYLESRFVLAKNTGTTGRVHLHNLRKRFGKEFLDKSCLAPKMSQYFSPEQEPEKQHT